jgi:ribonucleoside-diphosphate reductase alpha chain
MRVSPATHFSDPAAVDAWDDCFRWRDGPLLRDLTIDFTWRRVSEAVALAEGSQASAWAARFFDAFRSWRLLPDQRILRLAGTGVAMVGLAAPCAVLNAAAFVSAAGTRLARFERDQFADASELAVRLLDNAVGGRDGADQACAPSIGMVGLGDALHGLRLAYDSESARGTAGAMAAALAEGALRGSSALAAERGAVACDLAAVLERCRHRGLAEALLRRVAETGLRHAELTAIGSQPTLARLANNASDALDPQAMSLAGTARRIGDDRIAHRDTPLQVPLRAQLEMRAAMQPWIDAAIDYPLACASEPDADTLAACRRLASSLGLPPVQVRVPQPAEQADLAIRVAQ